MKRTGIKRSGSLLRRTPMPQPTQPIRPQSKRRQRENVTRKAITDEMRAEQPWCSRCGTTEGLADVDEKRSAARGGSRIDRANMQLLCRRCHAWKHGHETEAADEGWSLSQYGGTR